MLGLKQVNYRTRADRSSSQNFKKPDAGIETY